MCLSAAPSSLFPFHCCLRLSSSLPHLLDNFSSFLTSLLLSSYFPTRADLKFQEQSTLTQTLPFLCHALTPTLHGQLISDYCILLRPQGRGNSAYSKTWDSVIGSNDPPGCGMLWPFVTWFEAAGQRATLGSSWVSLIPVRELTPLLLPHMFPKTGKLNERTGRIFLYCEITRLTQLTQRLCSSPPVLFILVKP